MKMMVINAKKLRYMLYVLALAAGAFALVLVVRSQSIETVSNPGKRLPIYGVNTEEKRIALTFDCAWENSDTKVLMELLEQNGVKATFFTTGDWCDRYPDDVKAFAVAGHDIGNHSYAHPHVASIGEDELITDTEKCDRVIEGLTGKKPTLYRAPYGEYSDKMLEVIEDKLGKQTIQWDCDSRDWQKREASDMVQTILKKVRPGSILLFHNDTQNTPAALRQLLPELKGQGYEFVLVRELIYQDGYMLDHEGRQVKASS